jgi:riboflavin kinase/FMN adenylyltransferase
VVATQYKEAALPYSRKAMETLRGHRVLPRRLKRPVVAIGNFDGVHHGHAFIFSETRRLAEALDGEAVVLTFDPHPAKVLAPMFAPLLITPLQRKLELIAAQGVDVTIVEPFDRALAGLSPEAFCRDLLAGAIGAAHVCVGYDFTFGAGRAGNTASLAELGRALGFSVTVIPPVSVEGMVCSSTKVREFVLEGRVDGAARVLGRPPEVEGQVIRGDGRGRSIGVPTANLRPDNELLPKTGVYAGWAERCEAPGQRWAAAINVGTNPTFGADRPVSVEAHLIDAELDLYGARLRLGFVARLRNEQRFPTKEALVDQIRADVAATRKVMTEVA